MNRSRAAISVVLAATAVLLTSSGVGATPANPGRCAVVDSQGYCVEWDVPTPGGPGGRGGGGSSDGVSCYWVTIPDDLSEDPTIWFDFDLTPPPEGVTVVWQSWECSDGSATFAFRWVVPATPANLASIARGRLVGVLPQPTLSANPPVGRAAIVRVPSFVEVTNWTGVVTDSECAGGLCVTVSASPALTFTPGEQGSARVACAGSGSRYDPDGASMEEQAATPGACAYTFRLRTGVDGRPTTWPGSVSVTWTISWSSSAGGSGSLPSVTRTSALPRGVEEVQAVVVGGSTP